MDENYITRDEFIQYTSQLAVIVHMALLRHLNPIQAEQIHQEIMNGMKEMDNPPSMMKIN